jgi:spore coat polysaccharide biosynthesis predicted glycosyltransferase SpsG
VSGGVLVRCDGSPEIGLGHVVRCLALARELRDRHGHPVTFIMRIGALGMGMVRQAGFPVFETPKGADFDYGAWLADAVETTAAEILVLDVRDGLTLDDVRAIRERTRLRVAVIDDTSDRRLAADDVFYPPVPQARALKWPGFAGRVHTGWEWVLLRPAFAAEPRRAPHEPPVVLIAMGGSDPAGLTLKAMRALERVPGPIECVLLLGPGFLHDAQLGRLLESCPHVSLIVRDGDVRAQMLAADLAVLSFGVTAYEAAACALPAVHLCLTEDHALSSSVFAQAGLAVSLGRADQVEEARLAEVVGSMLADHAGRRAMGARARDLVDGAGTARIAAVLAAGRSG